jgi:hypothetical protein
MVSNGVPFDRGAWIAKSVSVRARAVIVFIDSSVSEKWSKLNSTVSLRYSGFGVDRMEGVREETEESVSILDSGGVRRDGPSPASALGDFLFNSSSSSSFLFVSGSPEHHSKRIND